MANTALPWSYLAVTKDTFYCYKVTRDPTIMSRVLDSLIDLGMLQ